MFGIVAVFLAAAFLRIYLVTRDSAPFAYDMGRDLLWSKDISFYGIPTLIGPAASIWGIYFPPFWFYFLSVPLRIAGGYPLSAVFATSLAIVATGALSYLLFKRELSKFYALALAAVLLFSSTLINISTFVFHANMLPILTLGFIYFSQKAVTKNAYAAVPAVFLVGLMYSADPAPAVVMTFVVVAVFLYFRLYKLENFKKLLAASLAAYTIPLSPNILFEIRNNFPQTQALLAYFRGENSSLSGQLPFLERLANRVDVYLDFFKASFAPETPVAGFLLVIVAFGIYRFFKNHRKNTDLAHLLKINLLIVIVSFLVMTFIFTVEIKNWYLYGLTIPFAFLIIFALAIFKRKTVFAILIIYLLANLLPFFQNKRAQNAKSDPATLSNQMAAINYIYGDKRSGDFAVYIFTPSIYDHHWQYLFWWQGAKIGKGLPADFAYLPDQPDYVRNKNIYAPNPQKSNLVYLVIENSVENEFYTKSQWLKNFQDFKLISQKDIKGAITVQKRQK